MLLEILVLVYVVLSLLCFTTLMLTWTRRPVLNRAGLMTLACLSLLCFCSFIEILSTGLEALVFLHLLRVVLIVAALTAFAFFVLEIVNRSVSRNAYLRWNLIIVAAFFIIFVVTDPLTHIFFGPYQLITLPTSDVEILVSPPGLLYNAFTIYAFVAGLTFAMLFLRHIWWAQGRKVFLVILSGISMPFIVSTLFSTYDNPYLDNLGIIAITASLSALTIYYTAFRFGILNIAPLAKQDLFHTLQDAVAILDSKGVIIDANRRFQETAGRGIKELVGVPVRQALSPVPELAKALEALPNCPSNMEVAAAEGRFIEVSSRQFSKGSVGERGVILQFHDLTERRHMELELARMHEEVEMLSQLARHDIVNQAIAIRGYASLMEMKPDRSEGNGYLKKVQSAASKIEQISRFAKEYSDMRGREPQWLDLRQLFQESAQDMDLEGVVLALRLECYEVLADHMLVQVFSTMLDNSLRHGMTLSSIQVSYQLDGQGLLLVYEDDGVGVPAEEKERIFDKGYGKHTGTGLYYARGILSLNGLKMRENGAHGKGARFEVLIPPGRFRVRSG